MTEPFEEKSSWLEEVGRIDILDAHRVRIQRNRLRQLVVLVDGTKEWVGVRPLKAFPLSKQGDFVGFFDDKDREVALMRSPDRLDPESREVLDDELSRVYGVPKVTRIYRVVTEHGLVSWETETDRGYAVIEVTDREQIRHLPGGRVILLDVDGNRYEIEDVEQLDARSRAWVEREL